MGDDDAEAELNYIKQLGENLRSVRNHLQWNLHTASKMTKGEYGPSVIGAYERGDRILSVANLNRLAFWYGVPIDVLLPNENGPQKLRLSDLDAYNVERPLIGVPRDPAPFHELDAETIITAFLRTIANRRAEGLLSLSETRIRSTDIEALSELLSLKPVPRMGSDGSSSSSD